MKNGMYYISFQSISFPAIRSNLTPLVPMHPNRSASPIPECKYKLRTGMVSQVLKKLHVRIGKELQAFANSYSSVSSYEGVKGQTERRDLDLPKI